jgi:hypothetical protein
MRRGERAFAALVLLVAAARPAHAWIPVGGGEKPKLEIETRFQFWGVSYGEDLVATDVPDQTGNVNDFFLRRGRVLARYRPTESLELLLQAGQDNWGTKTAVDQTGFRIKDFFVNWKTAEPFQVVAGQFKVPFLRNNLESGFNQLLVDRPAVTAIRPAREGSRDLGVMAWGNAGGLQYRAALFDGSDQEDLNSGSSPRGSGRVAWNWGDRETGLGYTGSGLGKQKVLQVGLQGDIQSDRADPQDLAGLPTALRDYAAWAIDLYVEHPIGARWAITGEGAWIERSDDYQDPALADNETDAFYVQAGLLLPFEPKGTRFQIGARFDRIDSPEAPITSATGKTVGFNWYIRGHDQKIQIDYTHRTEEPVSLDDDSVRLSVVMVF